MSLDDLPDSIAQGVKRFADQFHISSDEALLQLIQTGLAAKPQANRSLLGRQRQLKRGPQPPVRTNNPNAIIGLFANTPQLVEGILDVVESRPERYSEGA